MYALPYPCVALPPCANDDRSAFIFIFFKYVPILVGGLISPSSLHLWFKYDFPAGGPHQSLEGKKAALQHATIRAHEHKPGKVKK